MTCYEKLRKHAIGKAMISVTVRQNCPDTYGYCEHLKTCPLQHTPIKETTPEERQKVAFGVCLKCWKSIESTV